MASFRQLVAVVLIIAFGFVQSGCSMVVPGKQRFTVTASEPDAKVYINGEYVGKGNVQTRVRRNQDVSVLVKKEGFEPVTRSVGTDFSMAGILDIVGGFIILVPWLGLLFPGARALEQTNLAVVMEPMEAKDLAKTPQE